MRFAADSIRMMMLLLADPMEIEIGREAIRKGSAYVKQIDGVSFALLRKYFAVDNAVVARKLALMFFPFRNAEWSSEGGEEIRRAELYVPLMGFVSYVVVRALQMGISGTFSAERLGLVVSRLVVVEAVFVAGTKVAGYFFDVGLGVPEVVSYSGYKYVVVLVWRMSFGYVRWIVGMYLSVSFFVFLSRSVKGGMGLAGRERKGRVYYLFGVVVAIELMMFVLSR